MSRRRITVTEDGSSVQASMLVESTEGGSPRVIELTLTVPEGDDATSITSTHLSLLTELVPAPAPIAAVEAPKTKPAKASSTKAPAKKAPAKKAATKPAKKAPTKATKATKATNPGRDAWSTTRKRPSDAVLIASYQRHNGDANDIAAEFDCSAASVYTWLSALRKNGALPQKNTPTQLDVIADGNTEEPTVGG